MVKQFNIEHEPVLSELAKKLKAYYGQRLVDLVLFGSRARGEAEHGSDYDVMVVLNGNVDRRIERQATREIILILCRKYDVVIMCHFISPDRYRQERSPFMMNVRREGVLV